MAAALLKNAYYRAKNGITADTLFAEFVAEREAAMAARDAAEFAREDAYWTAMDLDQGAVEMAYMRSFDMAA